MKHAFYWIVALFMLCSEAFSQCNAEPIDLLVARNRVDSVLFADIVKGDTALLDLLLAAGPVADTVEMQSDAQLLDQLFLSLDSAKLIRKSPKKIVQTIFETVHDGLLKKYEFENQFCEIFRTGYYNCVSATAVYSYMLGRLGIHHAIVEVPSHVYVVAGFEDEDWVMESTDPAQGYYKLSEKDREEQIDLLVTQKLITREQRDSPQLDSILDAMYPSETISVQRLVSIQYQNQGIYDTEDERYFEAFQNALRAYIINRGESNRLLLIETMGNWLDLEEYDHPVFLDAMCFYIALDTSAEFINAVVEAYPFYGQRYLESGLNEDQFASISRAFIDGLASSDSSIQEIVWLNRLFRAQKLLEKRNGLEAYPLAAQAFRYDPTDRDGKRLLLGSLGFISYYEQWSKSEILDTMALYQEKYPDIREVMWNSLYAELLLQSMEIELRNQNSVKVARLRTLFEELMDNTSLDKQISHATIASVYGRMALRDYNQSKTRARQTIQKGLEYAPGHPDLIRYGTMIGL